MSRVYLTLGAALALAVLYWVFSDHLIGIGKKLCEGVNDKAQVEKLEYLTQQLKEQVDFNARLQAQHDADQKQIAADGIYYANALAHIRVHVPACGGGKVPAATGASGSESQSTGALDGSAGAGDYEIDASAITPDLIACEVDAAELNRLKTWARTVVAP